jgi:hypothetical protein
VIQQRVDALHFGFSSRETASPEWLTSTTPYAVGSETAGKYFSARDVTEFAQACAQPEPVEDVVAEHECDAIRPDVASTDHECAGKTIGHRLNCKGDGDTEMRTVPPTTCRMPSYRPAR